ALALTLVAPGDDHGLRRPGLAKMPRAEVDAIRGDQVDVLVIGLELERREREVVQPDRPRWQERMTVYLERHGDIEQRQTDRDQEPEGERAHFTGLVA